MGMISDLKELKKSWRGLPLSIKLFFYATTSIAALNIASLSQNIIEFRGFIRDGINFYQAAIDPLINWINVFFNISYSRFQVDAVILCNIVLVAGFRSMQLETSNDKPESDTTPNSAHKSTKYQKLLLISSILVTFASPMTDFRAGLLLLALYLFILLVYAIIGWVEGTLIKDLTLLHLNIAAPFLLLFIIAAISYGLSAPLS